MAYIYLYITILVSFTVSASIGCDQRYFDHDSFVCVCSESSCDNFPSITTPPLDGTYGVVKSSRDEFRFEYDVGNLNRSNGTDIGYAKILIDSADIRQSMMGFGAAFTDSTGLNVAKLSEPLQDTFIRQYFSPEGLEYVIGRIPIAGSDFSTYPYSYDDVEGDTELLNFSLTDEDYLYKIPYIKKAIEESNRRLYFFASPWSPPSWMKTNGKFNGSGGLIPEFQQPWANYFVKFLDSYKAEGINIEGLTVQNEPSAGATNYAWNCCHFTAEQEREFVRDYLGPTLNASGYDSIKLMIGDDQREFYPRYIETILADPVCYDYVDGIAVHWYSDEFTKATILTEVHNLFPDKFIIYTEACNGYVPQPGPHVDLGSWKRGERYASDIIDNVNNWSAGWTDWNMALDLEGGPNWAGNVVDAPVIINATANEFYKQPMFYAMGHFSKFIPHGSTYIGSSIEVFGLPADDKGGLDVSAFRHPTGYIVAVLLNMNEDAKTISIEDTSGNLIIYDLPPKSLQTFFYNE